MQTNRRRSACWLVGTMLGLLAAGCNGSSDDNNPAPAPGPAPTPSSVINDSACPLQFAPAAESPATGTDPLLSKQWHLNNEGNVAGVAGEDLRAFAAWQTTRGEGVRVAVVDDAIEVTHEDLAPNVVADASFNYRKTNRGSAYPLPCRDDKEQQDTHGTAVAGLVSARDFNARGVAGVAPRTGLVGYNALATELDADLADALGRDAANNAIYNNSWGSLDDGRLHPVDSTFAAAIQNGIANGRNGKGAIYVFPSGNGGCYVEGQTTGGGLSCIGENSNNDGYVNKLGVITACAVDADGRQPIYGERGANLLVCAPSSGLEANTFITTTAIQNTYRSDFTGTSASTPMVSGVAALILAANPELTWRDVRLILASTARQNDFPPQAAPVPDPEWTSHFGLHFSHKYGFGVADADAAVRAARTWRSVGGSSSLLKCGPFARTVNAPLPDRAGAASAPVPVASAIQVPACGIGKIEFVEVRLTSNHPSGGQLQVRLTSPQGLVSELADAHPCLEEKTGREVTCGVYNDYAFGSVRHLDEPVNFAPNSNWTLEVADMIAQTTGAFGRWSITFYGRP